MKNFTKQISNKALFKTTRWLLVALMLLLGTASAWAANSDYYLRGGFNDWNTNNRFDSNGNCTISLSANTTYEFKIAKSDWSKEFTYTTKTITATSTNLTLSTTGNNTKITTKTAGNYVFKFSESGKTLSVTYPASCTTPSITWNNFNENMCVEETQTLIATSNSGATVSFKSGTTANASISGTTLTAVKAGTSVITASVAASGNYCSASTTKTVNVINCIPTGTVLYLKPSTDWASANARFALYLFKDGLSEKWVDATPVCNNAGYYEATVPDGIYEKMIWCRMNPATTANNWDNKWNQTGDLTYNSSYNLFTTPSSGNNVWDGATTTWSKWTPAACCTPANVSISEWNVPATLCTGSSGTFKYTAASGASVTWKMAQSNNNYTITQSNGTVIITYNGTSAINSNKLLYSVSGTNICPETDKESGKTISGAAIPSISASTLSAQSICPGDKATLTVTSGKGTYTWVNTNGGENISDTDNSVQVSTAGTYTVTATDGNNCSSNTVEFTVTVKELQGKPVFTTPNTTVCESTAFTLPATDENVATLVWYTSAGASQNASVSAGITTQTVYYAAIAASDDKCETASNNRAEYTVNVDKKPNLDLTSTTETICQGEQITLSDYVNNNTLIGTVKWYSNSARTTEITDPSVARTPQSNPTNYYASATNGVCTTPAKADLTVTVKPLPSITGISASDNGKICSGSSVTITVSATNATSYQLFLAKGDTYEAVGEAQIKNEFYINEAGSYAVKAYNGTCESSYSNISITNKQTLTTADFTINIPEDYQVNQDGEDVSVIPNVDGVGEITISYYKNDIELDGTPSFIGVYTVKMTVSEGTEYCEMEETVIGSFSILCAPPHPAYYSIEKPEAVYNGEKQETKMLLYAGAGELLGVKYKLNREGEWVDPINVGVYGVYVTVAEGSHACAVEDYYAGDFTIICATATKDNYEITNASQNYDGTVKTPTVSPKEGTGAVIETMYKKGGNEVDPIESGTYEVWIKSEEGANYCAVTEWLYVGDFSINCPKPDSPSIDIESGVVTCNGELDTEGKIQITNYVSTNKYYIGNNIEPIIVDNNGFVNISTTSTTYNIKTTNACGVTSDPTEFTIGVTDNKPTITGNNSIQPGGNTVLTSDKGENTVWEATGGELNETTGAKVTFSAYENGTYIITATYNGCSTTYTIKVQDDLYVWVRRPIKKEAAYTQFYHEDQNSNNAIGGDLYYKEFATLPSDYKLYNQGGKKAEMNCTDKEGYMWYGFVVSKEAIENNYYFTVHAPNDGGGKGDAAKYSGYHTHTYATQLVDINSDLYFVMDETPSDNSRGWYINAPVVVRASGDAKFNANNFADFVPLYVKDANTCNKEVVSFEWQKSATENGAYTTYKSGKGINNIRTREAGWYRCVVTYGDGKGTATSNAIQVTTGATDVADYDSKYDVSNSNLPVIIVNTNGVGFPSDKNLSVYPSAKADDLKAKVSVDVIIKKGDQVLYDRKARMNYRGSSSLNFKKKSYAFVSGQDSCVFDKGRHDYVKTKKAKMFEVLGQSGYSANDKDWVLYAATPDPSMMRNRLVFDLYQQMRPKEWGVHTTYVELIVDGEYQGVYVFMDKITANEQRVNITNANGFIVKFDKTDCADRIGGYNGKVGDEKTFATSRTGTKNNSQGIDSYGTKIDQRFEIEYPEKEDIEDEGGVWEEVYQPIIDRFEEFEEALSLGNYTRVRDIIDYDSWADWFVLTEFIKNQDGFRASCIFTFSGEQGDKIKATPLWDQELSMNNRARTSHGSSTPSGLLITTSSIYSDHFPAPFWFTGEKDPKNEINGGLLKDECFVSLVKEKWAQYSAAEGILSKDNIKPMIEAYAEELEEGAQTREATKWPYTGEVRGMTNNGKTVGYFGKNEGTAVDYEDSKDDIISWAGSRVSPLTTEIKKLEGEAIIFTLNPENPETTPWAPVLLTVNVPDDYKYNMDFTALPADAVIKEGNNNYSIKLPQPSDWVPGGDGGVKSATYVVKAKLEIGDETTVCGTTIKAEKQSTITLRETYEDCSED